MVIGHGLLGKQFSSYEDKEDFLLFCSGVSNSTCTNPNEFKRETDLLAYHIKAHSNKRFVYFSTCSICDPSQSERPYVLHKLGMERIIQEQHPNYLIVRTSNLVGRTPNPNTVLNFLFNAILQEQAIELWAHAERNLIDIADVFKSVNYILENDLFKNKIIALANTTSYSVIDIVSALEQFLGKKAHYTLVDKGQAFPIPLHEIKKVYQALSIDFDHNYLNRLLARYYTQ